MMLCLRGVIILIPALLTLAPRVGIAETDPMPPPPARKIPGITTEDKFPNGCVDCHINMPDRSKDERLSTLMSQWNKKVDARLLKKAQAVAAASVTLSGVHPRVPAALKNSPAACPPCHGKTSKKAPPFAALLHSIHLTGGDDNHFLTIFQGECTYCHKMNVVTGVWSMPSGPEK